jgi:hypothetical protein
MNRPLKPTEAAGALEIELALDNPPLVTEAATEPAVADDDFEFDWYRDDCIVLREQPATAIYVNNTGSLVIRQEKTWDRDEDTFVYVRPEYAINFAKYLLKVAGHGEVEFCKRAGGGFVDLE